MDRYDPYFAEDTDGVHFEVCVEGYFVQGYVSRKVLSRACGTNLNGIECVGAYRRHRDQIDSAVTRRVRARGRETVIVQLEEMAASAPSDGAAGTPS